MGKINESDDLEWVSDLNLNSIDPNSRLSFIPPVGTRVRAYTTVYDTDKDIELEGEIINVNFGGGVFLLKLDGGWQQEFGWSCYTDGYDIDSKCYYLNIEDDEVYLFETPITKLHESVEKISVGDYLLPKRNLYYNNAGVSNRRFVTKNKFYKIIAIPDQDSSFKIIDDGESMHEFSIGYIETNFDVVPEADLPNTEKMFDDLFESEENDLNWAQEIVDNDIFKFSEIKSLLKVGDVIQITGDFIDDYGDLLLTTHNEPFIVKSIDGTKFSLSWINDVENRPRNWGSVCLNLNNNDLLIVNPTSFPSDDNLKVRIIPLETTEKIFDDLFESLDDDDLNWAQEIVNNDTFKFSVIKSILKVGDTIEVTGEIDNSDGVSVTLESVTLENEPFIVKHIQNSVGAYEKYEISWVNSEEQRPSNWSYVTITAGDVLALTPKSYPADNNLDIKIVQKK